MKTEINDRQRRFAELVVSGRPAGRAYEEAGYSARGASADSLGSKALRNDKVSEYIESLRKESANEARMTREDALEILEGIAVVSERDGDRIKAVERIARMQGWDEPEKKEVTLSSTEEAVKALMFGKR